MNNAFENKVPVDQVGKYIDAFVQSDCQPVDVELEKDGVKMTIQVKPVVGLDTFASAVENAAASCFDEADKYVPWMRDIAFAYSVIVAYTNIEVPEDLNDLFALLTGTDIYSHIVGAIDENQLAMLDRAIRRKIRHILDEQNSSREQELDRALAMLNFITQKYNEIGMIFNEIMGDDMKALMEKLQDHAYDVSSEVAEIKEKLGLEDEPAADEGGDE